MGDLSKPINGVGLAQINEIINERLEKKQNKLTGAQGQVVSFDGQGSTVAQDAPVVTLLLIQFGNSSLGADFTVSAGTESYSGMVTPETIQTICAVKQPNTEYTVTCGTNSQKVTTGAGFGPVVMVDMVFINCYVTVNIDSGTATAVKAKNAGNEIQFSQTGRTSFGGVIKKPGYWSIFVTKGDGSIVVVSQLNILSTDTSKTLNINLS